MSEDSKIVDARYKRLESLPLVSYRRKENAVTGFFGAIREVFSRRELLGLLVRRELVGRYKDSTLGLVWSMIRPLTQLLIYYLVMGEFLGAARNINNFAIFIFSGLTIYGLFSEVVNTMTSSIIANGRSTWILCLGIIIRLMIRRNQILHFGMILCEVSEMAAHFH